MITKKSIISFCVMLMTLITAQAQDQSLLYKIEGAGITTSYVYGTIHILPNKDFVLKDKVKKAFDETELVVLEIDVDDPQLAQKMTQHANMKNDASLKSFMSDEEYQLLDQTLIKSAGVSVAAFEHVKPFFLTQLLMIPYLGEQPASYEEAFAKLAAESKKEILGLEKIEEQMAFFDEIPYQDQVDEIIRMLKEEERTKAIFNEMVQLYKAENTQELYQLIHKYYGDDSEKMADIILHQRNQDWINKMVNFAEDQSVFFGVGAGHLGGNQGVVQLLRKAGYTVTAIN